MTVLKISALKVQKALNGVDMVYWYCIDIGNTGPAYILVLIPNAAVSNDATAEWRYFECVTPPAAQDEMRTYTQLNVLCC